MADSITRCPKCQTSFRITQAHLNSAKGAVRCGSCLNIFNARDHLLSATAEQAAVQEPAQQAARKAPSRPLTNKPKPAAKARPAQAQSKSAQPEQAPPEQAPPEPAGIDEEDDLLISDDMSTPDDTGETDPFNTDFNDNILYSKSLASTESNLFERELVDKDDDDDSEKSDESWALDLLENSDNEEQLASFEKGADTYSRVHESPEDDDSDQEQQEAEAFYANNFDDMELEDVEDEIRRTGFNEPVFTAAEPSLEDLERVVEDDYDRVGETRKPLIHAIEPEPVEFAYRSHFSLFESNLFWGPLTLLMGLALFALIAWLQFDRLSRIEPYRAYYGQACQVLGCQLPELVSRSEIKAVNLVVRSHPSTENALVVDAVLQNVAAFPQSFPSLDLIFTDVKENPVAARRFSPDQYLGGEMAGKTEMPSRQPIHIALEIVDPGPQAVGYRIEIAN